MDKLNEELEILEEFDVIRDAVFEEMIAGSSVNDAFGTITDRIDKDTLKKTEKLWNYIEDTLLDYGIDLDDTVYGCLKEQTVPFREIMTSMERFKEFGHTALIKSLLNVDFVLSDAPQMLKSLLQHKREQGQKCMRVSKCVVNELADYTTHIGCCFLDICINGAVNGDSFCRELLLEYYKKYYKKEYKVLKKFRNTHVTFRTVLDISKNDINGTEFSTEQFAKIVRTNCFMMVFAETDADCSELFKYAHSMNIAEIQEFLNNVKRQGADAVLDYMNNWEQNGSYEELMGFVTYDDSHSKETAAAKDTLKLEESNADRQQELEELSVTDEEEVKSLRMKLKEKDALLEEFQRKAKEESQRAEELKKEIEQLRKNDRELIALRNFIYSLEVEEVKNPEIDYTDMVQYLRQKRVIIVGGNDNWVSKVRKIFPEWSYLKRNATPNESMYVFQKCDYCCFNTISIGHSSYYRYITHVREHNIPFGYISVTNTEKIVEVLYKNIFDR